MKVAILCNTEEHIARSYCTWYREGDACCIIYDAVGSVLNHELGGHGFAFLRDEYVEKTGSFSDRDNLDMEYDSFRWGANVDWRSDPKEVRWARFLEDPRYVHKVY